MQTKEIKIIKICKLGHFWSFLVIFGQKKNFFSPKKVLEIFFRKFISKHDVWYQNQLSIIYRSQVMAKNAQK